MTNNVSLHLVLVTLHHNGRFTTGGEQDKEKLVALITTYRSSSQGVPHPKSQVT